MRLTATRLALALAILVGAGVVLLRQVTPDPDPAPAALPSITPGITLGEAGQRRFDANDLGVGDRFPAVEVFDAAGNPFNTRDLVGQYTVLVSGCLT